MRGTELLHRLGAFGRLHDVSANGWRGDWLFGWISIVIAIVFAIVVGQLAIVVVRRRGLPGTSRGDDRRAVAIVAGATLALFFAVDGVALVTGARDLDEGLLRMPTASEHAIEVEVLAQQWAWTFRLAGSDGVFGTPDDIVTMHALTLPVGRPARLQMRSKDVIHSLYLPAFRIKRDAQPGSTTELLVEPTEPGRFEIACAQHCGANHYKMRATLDVIENDAFARFVKDESALATQRAGAITSDGNWAWAFK